MPSLHTARTYLAWLGLCLFAIGCGASGSPKAGAVAQAPVGAPTGGGPDPAALSTPVWFVIADAGGGGGGNDRLYSVNITLPVPQNAQTPIGAGTGTNNIEGAAFWPGTDTLYAFNNDRLGTIDLGTGQWSQLVKFSTRSQQIRVADRRCRNTVSPSILGIRSGSKAPSQVDASSISDSNGMSPRFWASPGTPCTVASG